MTRRAKIPVFALLVVVFCCPFLWAQEKAAFEDDRLAALIETIKPSIVAVGTYYFNDLPKVSYLGTGFVIKGGRRLVTNFHVVQPIIEKKKLAYLRIFHKNFPNTGITAKIVATDEFHDLAILEQESDALPALKIGESSLVKEGYQVVFTGYPIGFILGLNPTTHTGMISGIGHLMIPSPSARIINGEQIRHLSEPYDIFQIDGTAYPGNSGSPVCRASSGEVIGVINKVFVKGIKEHALSDPTGITYAIPANFIRALEKSIPSSE